MTAAVASTVATGLVALPHVLLVLRDGRLPRLNYVVLLAACLFVVFSYARMVEACGDGGGGPSARRSVAAVLLPFLTTWALATSAALYSVNDRDLLVTTPLGQVRQYRLNDVIHRFRRLVATRQEEANRPTD